MIKNNTDEIPTIWKDVLTIGILLFMIFLGSVNNTGTSLGTIYKSVLFSLVFLIAKSLFSLKPSFFYFLFFVVISLVCFYESGLGFLQLIGIRKTNHFLNICTGSFNNPGPYGGVLAVCISLILSFRAKKEIKQFNTLLNAFDCATFYISLLAIIVLLATLSRSAIVGLCFSLSFLVFGTEVFRDKAKIIIKRHLWCCLVFVTILSSGLYFLKKPSADGRLFMDKICVNSMLKNGLKGAGFGYFGGVYGENQHDYFKRQIFQNGKDVFDWTSLNEHERIIVDCPDYAFNEYLSIGVEAGPFVLFLFIGIIISTIIYSYKSDTIWCYGLITLAVFALFSYPLHVWQFQIMIPVLLAASISGKEKRNNYRKITDVSILIIALITLSIATIIMVPEIEKYRKAEDEWRKIERWHEKECYEYVVEKCDILTPYYNRDPRFLFVYGQSLNKMGKYEKSDSILTLGANISSDPMFWNVMGNNSLAMAHYREAEECYKRAFYMVPNRLYPLNLLAKLYYTEGDTARFLDMADKVESFIPKVESARTEQLREEIRALKKDIVLKHEQ